MRKHTLFLNTLLSLLTVFFMLPVLSFSVTFLPEEYDPLTYISLSGKESKARLPDLSVSKILDGSFQSQFERWISRSIPLSKLLIKIDRQINLWFFQQVSARYGATIVVGKDNHLIERSYLRSANKIKGAPFSRVQSVVRQMNHLSDALADRGTEFLFLISANKPSLYPELIPASFLIPGVSQRKSSYDHFKDTLPEFDYLDGPEWLRNNPAPGPFRYFEPSGTHWSEWGACKITEQLTQIIADLYSPEARILHCGKPVISPEPTDADRDLAKLVNAFDISQFNAPALRPQTSVINPHGKKPRVLIVGTSFMWSVLRFVKRYHLFDKYDFLYYFNTRHSFPSGAKKSVKKDIYTLDYIKDRYDLVLFEVNEAFLHRAGHGLLKQLREQVSSPKNQPLPTHQSN